MDHHRTEGWRRREFLCVLTLAGTAGLLALQPRPIAAEPPPETTRLRIGYSPAICFAPLDVAAEQLLPVEGFVDVQYVKGRTATEVLVSGEVDFSTFDLASLIVHTDKGFAQGRP